MPYTVRDTPATVARVEADLAHVRERVRAADPRLRSLVLTGGFARGEGAFRDGRPVNDYDFIAMRRPGRSRVPYAVLRRQLHGELGIHIDLAPIATWRLRWVGRSIFWYETALRGRTVFGPDLLGRIRVKRVEDVDRREGLRLLVNRAAGLLLVTDGAEAEAVRLQAAKAFLAAFDARLFAQGRFRPSQRERWDLVESLGGVRSVLGVAGPAEAWYSWAYSYKLDPETAPARDPHEAWRTAAEAIIEAVPVALARAGLASLDEYARRDGVIDHLVYYRRSAHVDGARRVLLHPTGRVRAATLKLLGQSLDGRVRAEDAAAAFQGMATPKGPPLLLLDSLREATLQ